MFGGWIIDEYKRVSERYSFLNNQKEDLNNDTKKENIIDSGICSVCNSDIIHSYRAEKEGYGLNTALIVLK